MGVLKKNVYSAAVGGMFGIFRPFWFSFFFFKDFIYLSLEMGKEGEKQGERHQCERDIRWLSFSHAPTRDQTHNPGMCCDWN